MGIFSKKTAAVTPGGPVERGDETEVKLVCYTAVPAANQKIVFPLTTTVEEALKTICERFNVPYCEHYGLYLPNPFNSYLDNSKPLVETNLIDGSKVQVKIRANAPAHYSFHVETPHNVLSRMKKVKTFTETDHLGRTYLHLAAHLDYKVLVFALRKKGISVNDCDSFGRTALHYAARSGDLKRIEILIQNNASIASVCRSNMTSLHYVAEACVVDEVKYRKALDILVKAGESCFARDLEGNTPFHVAARAGNTVFMNYWIEKKMFISNLTNTSGETALHCAARANSLVMVRMLLTNGADRYILSADGKLPIDIARAQENSQVQEALSDILDGEMETIWTLIEQDRLNDFMAAIEKTRGTDDHASDKKVNTYLIWSAARFRLAFVNYLLDFEKMCPRFRVSGSSTLSCLVSCTRKAIAHDELYEPVLRKCIAKGGSANEKNDMGDSLLHIASLAANRVAVNVLLDNGGFTNSVNYSGYSELHYAILTEHEGLVSDLLRGHSDPNLATMSGETAIDFAVRVKKNVIAQFLAEASKSASADPNATAAFQPNAVKLTLISGRNLIAKDDTGFSDPYCVLKHRLGDLQAVHRSGVKPATLEPKWNETFHFAIKQDNVYYRDILIDIYDWDQPDADAGAVAQVDDFMGRASVLLDPRTKQQRLTVEVADQNGKAGFIEIELTYAEMGAADLETTIADSYKPFDVLEEVNAMLSNTGSKSVGLAKRALGYKPKYPVMIIPGLASSALICWETDKEAWKMERVWVDPFKIGKAAAFQKLSNKMKGKSKKEEGVDEDLNKDQRRWLKHILLAADGYSDPPGIKVRPVDGIHGCDYLSDSPLAKKATYVFGHVIQTLADAGYDPLTLDAAPYDWRIPPEKLETRDHYFTKLKSRIQMMRQLNNEKVVLMAHSMGNRCVQYFLEWLKESDPEWIDANIHAFLALGPPFLGACKSVRAVVSGDQMGLEVFLTAEEGRTMARGSASLPWLFPMQEEQFPDVIARINTSYHSTKVAREPSVPVLVSSSSRSSITEVVKETWEEQCVSTLVEKCAPSSFGYYREFYQDNTMYLNKYEEGKFSDSLPPILSPPPVKNLWVIAGVNLPTEMSYYFRPHVTSKGDTRYVLDYRADKYSEKKIAGVNPRGLQIAGGMGFETKNTYQPKFRRNRSGDGTVTYCSLMYVEEWREQAKAAGQQIDIQVVEVEGAEHRAMLAHDAVFSAIIDFVCEKPIG